MLIAMQSPLRLSARVRHRLLEGVVLRLARLADAGGLVLRGGLLLRHWFRPLARPAQDLDLVADRPLLLADAENWLPLFADEGVDDGVRFDPARRRVEAIWEQTVHRGLRFQVWGEFGDDEGVVQVDLTGGPAPTPPAVWGSMPTASGQVAALRVCRPEHVVGQKIQALWHMHEDRWRPKDLYDLYLLIDRMPLDPAILRAALDALMAEVGATREQARGVLGPGLWWSTKSASARWHDFVSEGWGRTAPVSLADQLDRIRPRLACLWEEG
jgi:hypothetical protein